MSNRICRDLSEDQMKLIVRRLSPQSHIAFVLAEEDRKLRRYCFDGHWSKKPEWFIDTVNVIVGLIGEQLYSQAEKTQPGILSLLTKDAESLLLSKPPSRIAPLSYNCFRSELASWDILEDAAEIALLVGDSEIGTNHLVLAIWSSDGLGRCLSPSRLELNKFNWLSKAIALLDSMVPATPSGFDRQNELAELITIIFEFHQNRTSKIMQAFANIRAGNSIGKEKPTVLHLRARRLLATGKRLLRARKKADARLCADFVEWAIDEDCSYLYEGDSNQYAQLLSAARQLRAKTSK